MNPNGVDPSTDKTEIMNDFIKIQEGTAKNLENTDNPEKVNVSII